MHDVINVQHLTRLPPDEFGRHDTFPPPVIVESEQSADYEVENVIDSRRRKGKVQYLAKFKGYPVAESLWYDEADSGSFSELVDEYRARIKSGAVRESKVVRKSRRKV